MNKEEFIEYLNRECIEFVDLPQEFKQVVKMRNGEILEIPYTMIEKISNYTSPILNPERSKLWKK